MRRTCERWVEVQERGPDSGPAWAVVSCSGDARELWWEGDDPSPAQANGRLAAALYGVELWKTDCGGEMERLETSNAARIVAGLRVVDQNHRTDDLWWNARKWDEAHFDADAAKSWYRIDVCSPDVAREFLGAGLTPWDVKAAARRLVRGLTHPERVYACGCPIYAACSGAGDVKGIIDEARRGKDQGR